MKKNCIVILALWQHACDKKMEMKKATPEQLPSYLRKGSTSLYDEVSMTGNILMVTSN